MKTQRNPGFNLVRWAAGGAVILLACLSASPLEAARDQRKNNVSQRDAQLAAALREATLKLKKAYSKDLAEVATWAVRNGLNGEARDLVGQIEGLDPDSEGLNQLKEAVARAGERQDPAALERARKTFSTKLKRIASVQAKRLFTLASQCFRVGLFSRSYDLLLQVLTIAPDDRDTYQKRARKVLGYTWDYQEKKWITDWEAEMKKTHFLTDEGWVPKKDKRNWEKGLRPYKGKWVSMEREREIRTRNEYNPFRVESEHFEVLTNLGRKEAWQYATMLEDFNRTFYRVFIGYYDPVAGARLLFNKEDLKNKHQVYLFPSRNDYLIHVKAEFGNNPILRQSAGFYSTGDAKSRFYWSQDITPTLDTLYHEVTHQLFAETKTNLSGSSTGNNWVVEGLATYVETWEKIDGEWYPGRNTRNRYLQLVKKFLEGSPGWSLADFITIGNLEFHQTNRGLNYALSCALTHFFFHYDNEVYKEDFVRFVSAYYGGKVGKNSLADYISGKDTATLEKEFREYMAKL